MLGLSRGTYIIDCNSKIQNSSVINTSINMSGGVITNHGTPVNPTDSVNKAYVDSISSGGQAVIPTTVVTLISTNYAQAITVLSGSLLVLVKNIVTNGPSATFLLSKSEPGHEPSVTRLTSSSNNITGEKLRIKWDPNTYIQLRKTGVSSDGDYLVKYIS